VDTRRDPRGARPGALRRGPPRCGETNWKVPWVGVARAYERIPVNAPFTWVTSGATVLADSVLGGTLQPSLAHELSSYGGINTFLERRKAGRLHDLTT
jgi:hypothetical protein